MSTQTLLSILSIWGILVTIGVMAVLIMREARLSTEAELRLLKYEKRNKKGKSWLNSTK